MAGLVPAIHAFSSANNQDVDARHKRGHDGYDAFCLLNRPGWSGARVEWDQS
jgi:hypothetical protein